MGENEYNGGSRLIMSTLKVDGIRSNSASSDAITLANDGTCTAQLTNKHATKNLIHNGAMTLAQYGITSTTEGYGTVDRFRTDWDGLNEAVTQSHHDLTSSETPYSHGFTKKWKITNGDQTSVDAGDWLRIIQGIEAQNVRTSGWKYTDPNSYLTISFWVRSSVAQTYYFHVKSYDGTPQTYAHPYALSANTWTKVTHSIPGNANLQFDDDNNLGLDVQWALYYGTNYTDSSASDNTWVAHNAASQTKVQTSTWYDTNDATFELTGAQLEVGDIVTDFQFELKEDTLRRCQRYYYVLCDQAGGSTQRPVTNLTSYTTTHLYGVIDFPVTMAYPPSIISTSGTNYFVLYGGGGTTGIFAPQIYSARTSTTTNELQIITTSPNLATAGSAYFARTQNASARVAFTAEFF